MKFTVKFDVIGSVTWNVSMQSARKTNSEGRLEESGLGVGFILFVLSDGLATEGGGGLVEDWKIDVALSIVLSVITPDDG